MIDFQLIFYTSNYLHFNTLQIITINDTASNRKLRLLINNIIIVRKTEINNCMGQSVAASDQQLIDKKESSSQSVSVNQATNKYIV